MNHIITSLSSSLNSINDDSVDDKSPNDSKRSFKDPSKSLKSTRKFRQSIQCGDAPVKGLSIVEIDSKTLIVNFNSDGKIQIWDIFSSLTTPIKQFSHSENKEKRGSFNRRLSENQNIEKKNQSNGILCMATITHRLIAENNNHDVTLTIVTGSKDGRIRIYNMNISTDAKATVEPWEVPITISDSKGSKLKAIRSIAIKEVNQDIWIVSGEEDGHIGVWDHRGSLIFDYDPIIFNQKSIAITSLYIHAKDDYPVIVSGNKDDVISKWGTDETDGLLQSKNHCLKSQSGISSILVYEAKNVDEHFETIIISAGSNNCIIIWSYTNLEKLRTLEGHSDSITSLCIYSDSDPFNPVIMSSSRDRTMRFWHFRTGKCTREMKIHVKNEEGRAASGPVNCIACTSSHQDFLVISGGDDCNIRLTDFNGDELIYTFKNTKDLKNRKIGPSLCLTSTDFLQGPDNKRSKLEFLCPFILESDVENNAVVVLTSCLDNDVQNRIELDGLDNGITDGHLSFFHIKHISNRFPSNIIALIKPPRRTKVFEYNGRYGSDDVRKEFTTDHNTEEDFNDMNDDARYRSESFAARHRSGSTSNRYRSDTINENAHKNPSNYCYLWPIILNLKCSKIELRGHADVVTCVTFCESDVLVNNKRSVILTAVTGSADGTLRRWDVSTGKCLGFVEAHMEGVSTVKSFKQMPKDEKKKDHDNDDLHDKNETNDSINNKKASNSVQHFQSYIVSGGSDFFVKIYAANSIDGEYASVIEDFEHEGEVLDIAIHNVAGQDIQIITTAADKIIRIISFNSLEIKQQIKSNCIGSITSLAIHSFNGRASTQWISIGTSDGITQLWDVRSEQLLRELKSSSNKEISDVAIVSLPHRHYANVSYRREPVVVTINSDGAMNIMESFFACKDANSYPVLTPALVRREYRWDQHKNIFLLDSMNREPEKEDEEAIEFEDEIKLNKQKKLSWPRLSNLVERCQAANVFSENAGIFWTAIDEGRSDFIDYFLRDVPDAVTVVFKDEQKLCRTMLGKALYKKDLQSVRVILSCWKTLITQSSKENNSLFNHYFFVSDHLHKDCLVELSKRYPNEFHDFIKDLKTIPSHPCVSVNCEQAMLHAGKCRVAGVNDSSGSKELWSRHLDESSYRKKNHHVKSIKKQTSLNAPVVATFLPINYAASNEILTCLVKTSTALNTVDLFETDIGRYAVHFAWESYGKALHIRSMVEYSLYLGIFSVSCFLFEDLQSSDDNDHYPKLAWAIQGVVLLGVTYLFILELYQAKGHWFQHSLDVWNLQDIASYLTVFIGTLLRIIYLGETRASSVILSVASLLCWFKTLYFLRGFEGTGPFVSILFIIAYEIRFFLLVLLIALMGFAQSFYMVGGDSPAYGTLPTTLLILTETMLGVTNYVDFSTTISEEYSTVLYMGYCLVIILLLLNMLIAQMNQTYTAVASKGFSAQFKYERAKIIIEEFFLLSKSQQADPSLFPRSIHVLRRYADVEQEKYEDEKESDLASIKKMVESMKDKVNDLENRISTSEERTVKQMNSFEKHSELMKAYLEKVQDSEKKILQCIELYNPIIQRTSDLQESHESLLQTLRQKLMSNEQSCNPLMMITKLPFNENEKK